jgi:serine/threonine-protein kinase
MTTRAKDRAESTVSSNRRAQDLAEQRAGMRRLLFVGLVFWPLFFVADVIAALSEHRPDVLVPLLVIRTFGWAAAFAAYLVVTRRAALSLRGILVIDFSIPTLIGTMVGLRALYLGGLDEKLAVAVLVGAVTRAALLPSRWPRAFAASMCAAIAYPAVLAIASAFSPTLRAQWTSPAAAACARVFVLTIVAVGMCSFASHVAWTARREVYEAQRLGTYRLRARIGKGAHGDVWIARQESLDRDVALKVLRERGSDEESIRRFEREARAASTLAHPNTIRIFDYGATSKGASFIAMELLVGLDLDVLVESAGPLPPARVVHLARQACGSLAEAHDAGIVHRDVKPANLFVTRVGDDADFVKILDFGVAGLDAAAGDLTETGALLGTPQYMAPEVCEGERADARSDMYSLGAVLYFMLTAHAVFDGGLAEVVMAHVNAKPAPPSTHVASLPADLERVVMRCLAKRPDERFATMRELEAALAACECAGQWTAADARRAWAVARAGAAENWSASLAGQ